MNDDISVNGQSFLKKVSDYIISKAELIETRQTLVNLELGLEAIQGCLFVMETCRNVSLQIDNKKYYSALKSIQELQSNYINKVKMFSFASLVNDWLPTAQFMIREAVIAHLGEWFQT
jgi:hypothetical protein